MAAANPAQLLLAELTCSVCLDYFKDPASLACGHHFCLACITQCWEELSTDFPCPECRETFSQRNFKPNRQLRNIVEASRKLTLELTKEPEVGTVCDKHQRALDDFCQEDQTPICLVCHLSGDHREHTVVPIEEAAADYKIYTEASEISDCSGITIPSHTLSISSHLPFSRANHPETKMSLLRLLEEQDQIRSRLESLRKESEEILTFKLSGEEKSHELLKQLETEKQKIVSQFQQLRQFLEEQERHLLAQLEELNKEIEKGRAEYVAKLSEELSSFSSLISEMEQKCQLPASEFLQDIKGTLSRCERETFQNPVAFSSELKWRIWESSQRNASLETRMRTFKDSLSSRLQLDKANVTLDPDTAHPYLILSADRKSVRWGDTWQDLADNPEGFDTWSCVLGCEGFTSGRHYWEVEVEGRGVYVVGVARESMSPNAEQGIWAVQGRGDRYWALTSPEQGTPCTPCRAPRRIRVYLDCEGGWVAFFDAGCGEPIITFPLTSLAGDRIRPLFQAGVSVRLL